MHHQMMGYPMHQINPYGVPMSHVHHHGAHFLDDQRLGTLSEPGAHFADLSDLQSEIGKPMNKGLKGLSASVPDLTGKSSGVGRTVVGLKEGSGRSIESVRSV